ncbi:MAG: hypothetical protein AAFU85_33380 [Planctomycetota bacterium]
MYESLILVDNESSITIDALAAELQRFYADDKHAPLEISAASQTITLRWDGYVLQVAREQLPHVIEESAEIAAQFGADHPAKDRIAKCICRFCITGDDDPDMMHFNDYLYVGEALDRLGTVYRFDQSTCEFS